MTRKEKMLIAIPVVLSLTVVWVSFDYMQRMHHEATVSAEMLADVETAAGAIRELRSRLTDSRKLAPVSYDPSTAVVEAIDQSDIERPGGFALRRQPPRPLPGSPYAHIDIGLPPLEMTLPELVRLLLALWDSPIQHQAEQVILRPARDRPHTDSDTTNGRIERWEVEIRAGYLVLADELPQASRSRR